MNRVTTTIVALAAGLSASASALAQNTERVSLHSGSAITQPNAASLASSITPDGRYVVFTNAANGIVPGDTNGVTDVFVRDRWTNATIRVSVPDPATGNAQANAYSGVTHAGARCISNDGRFVVFHSAANNLVANDTNDVEDIFVRDRDLDGNGVYDEPGLGKTKTVRVSLTTTEGQSFGSCPNDTCTHQSYNGTISADGRYVAWESSFDFAGSEAFSNIYLRDRDADQDGIFDEAGGTPNASTTILVTPSISCAGCEHNGFTANAAISADGRHVAFVSASSRHVFSDFNNAIDVFVRDTLTNTTTRMSVRDDGNEGQPGRDSAYPSISANGRYVAFHSNNNDLIPQDTDNFTDVFVRDRDNDNDGLFDETGTSFILRVSTGTQNFPEVFDLNLDDNSYNPCISADGRYVAFVTDASNFSCFLFCTDDNPGSDIVIRDRVTNTTRLHSVSNTGAQANASALAPAISADGKWVAFTSSATNLYNNDANGSVADAYVRVTRPAMFATCNNALHVVASTYNTESYGGSILGNTTCGNSTNSPSIFFEFTPNCSGVATIDTLGSSYDTVLSVHSACPGSTADQLACNDDTNGLTSAVTLHFNAGTTYFIRVSGFNGDAGFVTLNVGNPCDAPCPADWDRNGIVNAADVGAYLTDYFQQIGQAGLCDLDNNGVVNAADFGAYLTLYFQSLGPCL